MIVKCAKDTLHTFITYLFTTTCKTRETNTQQVPVIIPRFGYFLSLFHTSTTIYLLQYFSYLTPKIIYQP